MSTLRREWHRAGSHPQAAGGEGLSMDVEVVRERFDELLKVLAASGLPSSTRRILWVAALDALDKAVAEGRVPNWPFPRCRPE